MSLPGPTELIIVLLIVIVIFGASRVTDIMGAFGRGVAEFRKGAETGVKEEAKKEETKTEAPKNETPKSV